MKRGKIKSKYLNLTNNDINNKYSFNKINAFFKSIALLFLLLFGELLIIVCLAIFGISYSSLTSNAKLIISIIWGFLSLFIIMFAYKDTVVRDFKNFFNKKFLSNMGTSLSYWMIGLAIMIVSNLFISIITNGGMPANEESVRDLIDKVPLYMLFNVIIYAPITEELVFRKSFKDFISNKYVYVLTSGLVFGGLHIISSLTDITGLLYIVPYGTLGITFAILYKKTDNIFSTISVHALHNFISFVILVLGKYFI